MNGKTLSRMVGAAMFSLLCLAGTAHADDEFRAQRGSDEFAYIIYQARGNINIREGTYEVWFKTGFDPGREVKHRFYCPFNVFSVRDSEAGVTAKRLLYRIQFREAETEMSLPSALAEHMPDPRFRQSLAFTGKYSGTLIVDYEDLHWEKDQWYHLAVTWKWDGDSGDFERKIYVDGELMNECSRGADPIPPEDLSESHEILIGSVNHHQALATLDSLRISSVARSALEIRKSYEEGIGKDDDTLLFELFDNEENGKLVLSADGVIDGSYELVDTKFGRGVKLHVVEEE